ncbi:hypothetical protein [Haloplanus sp. C73]|uniref:hypothetical protein n=1 Tax=Haloplanus sp. C73 TaxID=3421641 RepID=UPI003EB75BAC
MPGHIPRTDGGDDALTAEQIAELADAYERREPFDLVEREHTQTLPKAFAAGDFGRRDAEWVVQWYYRRGDVDDAERRAAEERFLDNDYETMVDGLQSAAEATAFDERLGALTSLTGVDVPVASAFLAYTHPDECVAIGEREWTALHEAGELDEPYPADVTAADYKRYLDAVRAVADRTDHDLWTVYRALWRRGD